VSQIFPKGRVRRDSCRYVQNIRNLCILININLFLYIKSVSGIVCLHWGVIVSWKNIRWTERAASRSITLDMSSHLSNSTASTAATRTTIAEARSRNFETITYLGTQVPYKYEDYKTTSETHTNQRDQKNGNVVCNSNSGSNLTKRYARTKSYHATIWYTAREASK
jgi:hypothetical protein